MSHQSDFEDPWYFVPDDERVNDLNGDYEIPEVPF